jgi:hypothetical protein
VRSSALSLFFFFLVGVETAVDLSCWTVDCVKVADLPEVAFRGEVGVVMDTEGIEEFCGGFVYFFSGEKGAADLEGVSGMSDSSF